MPRLLPLSVIPLSFVPLCFVGALLALGCHGKYIRPVSATPIERTGERLQRGSYLVNQVMLCPACHTSRANGNILIDPERTDAYLGGGNIYTDKGLGRLWIPNLTPDPDTGLGRWTDDEIMRAIRDGVSADGHFLIPLMPFFSFQHVSDEDARSIVAYLRSIPPYKQPKPREENQLGFMQKMLFKVIGVQMHPPAVDVVAPPKTDKAADKVAYGHYLARIGACTECHSLTAKGPLPETDPLYLAGSEQVFEDPALGQTYPRNLTPDRRRASGTTTPPPSSRRCARGAASTASAWRRPCPSSSRISLASPTKIWTRSSLTSSPCRPSGTRSRTATSRRRCASSSAIDQAPKSPRKRSTSAAVSRRAG